MTLNDSGLARFQAGIPGAIDRGTWRRAEQVREVALQLVPVDQGDLQSTGRLDPEQPNGSAVYSVVFGGINGPHTFVDYAIAVERGTDNPTYPAQPYLEPAVREIDPRIAYQDELQSLVARSRI